MGIIFVNQNVKILPNGMYLGTI